MEVILKLTGIITVSVVLITVLRHDQPALSMMLSLVAMAVVFAIGSDAINSIVSIGRNIANLSSLSEKHLSVLLKVLGVTILTKLTGDFCKDAGCTGLSGVTEMIGNLLAIISAIPLLEELLKFISSI